MTASEHSEANKPWNASCFTLSDPDVAWVSNNNWTWTPRTEYSQTWFYTSHLKPEYISRIISQVWRSNMRVSGRSVPIPWIIWCNLKAQPHFQRNYGFQEIAPVQKALQISLVLLDPAACLLSDPSGFVVPQNLQTQRWSLKTDISLAITTSCGYFNYI